MDGLITLFFFLLILPNIAVIGGTIIFFTLHRTNTSNTKSPLLVEGLGIAIGYAAGLYVGPLIVLPLLNPYIKSIFVTFLVLGLCMAIAIYLGFKLSRLVYGVINKS